MSLPTTTEVLIIGAGPTGMACALTLLGHGLQVTIVDAFQDNKNGSRSVGVHSHTLEVLKTVGLAEPLIEAGYRSPAMRLYGSSQLLMEVDFVQLQGETEFPFVLLIPQDKVEKILREKLAAAGVHILRPHSAVGLREALSGGGLEVTFDDGSIVSSRYVIGADGSRSTIRRLANINFKDPATGVDYDGKMPSSSTFQMALADVYIKELPASIPLNRTSLFLNRLFFFVPMISGGKLNTDGTSFWRIGIASPSEGPSIPRHPDIAWIQEALNIRCPWDIKPQIVSVLASSRYRVRAAVASTFFKKLGGGNMLLVGDAAHVHSPAGAQGLNLGLCDAVALGNAIRTHISRTAENDDDETNADVPLKDYAISRRKIALRVVGMTTGMTNLVNAGTGWKVWLRNLVLWIGGMFPFVRKAAAWRLSGLINRDF